METKKENAFKKSVNKLADSLLKTVTKEVTDTMPKWRRGTPPHKGVWLTRTTHADGHVSIACERFQDDKWPHEGDDRVLYMDMNELGAMQEAESLKDQERIAAENDGFLKGYAQAKSHYFDTFKDRRFEELLSQKISEWQASGDDPDVMEAELEEDAKLLKAAAVRSEGEMARMPSSDDILSFCDTNLDRFIRGRFFVFLDFAMALAEWLQNGQKGDGNGNDGQ